MSKDMLKLTYLAALPRVWDSKRFSRCSEGDSFGFRSEDGVFGEPEVSADDLRAGREARIRGNLEMQKTNY